MRFSIIIPVEKAGKIDSIISSLNKAIYPIDKLEIIVVYGNQPSVQRNKAVEQAYGELVYFFDNDSEPIQEIFNIVAEHFRDPDVAVVGGPNLTPERDNFLQHCFGMALASRFANGKVSARYCKMGELRETDETELILCNLCVRGSVFKKLGGFNENLYPNEENEFINRLKRDGYKILYDPEACIYRRRRRDFRALIKQHLNYGRGRMEQTLIEGFNCKNLLFFIPLGFVIYILALFFVSGIYYFIPLEIYLLFAFCSSLSWALKTKKITVFFIMPIIYFTIHFSYGLGMIKGIYRRKNKYSERIRTEVEVTKLKKMADDLLLKL